MTIEQAYEQATAARQAGQHQEAERLYQGILAVQPRHAGANHSLGVLAMQVGKAQAGVQYFRTALQANLGKVEYWVDYIEALRQSGQAQAARNVLEQGRQRGLRGEAVNALAKRLEDALGPGQFEIDNLLEKYNSGMFAEVAEQARELTLRFPDHFIGWKLLGAACSGMEQYTEALNATRRAVVLAPSDPALYNNLGNIQRKLEQPEAAIESYRHALSIAPDFAEAHNNLGSVFNDLERYDDALACYRKALELNPENAETHSNLGVVLHQLKQFDAATASYGRALSVRPNYPVAYLNLGFLESERQEYDKALEYYRHALKGKPNYAEAYRHIGNVMRDIGDLEGALQNYRHALAIKPHFEAVFGNLLMSLNYQPDQDGTIIYEEAKRYGELVSRKAKRYSKWENDPDPDRKLSIGLVSGDFGEHAVGVFISNLLTGLATRNPRQIEFVAYVTHMRSDTMSARLLSCCSKRHVIAGISDEKCAQQIREDGIDILIDLSGHTRYNRLPLFAWKPAPIQVTYLGYPNTTGLQEMDYRLTDAYTEPEGSGADAYYTEKLVRLSDCMWNYLESEEMIEVSGLPALKNGYVTFGSFNNANKLNDACIEVWATLLKRMPESRLLMVTVAEGMLRTKLKEQFRLQGVEPGRVDYCDFLPTEEFKRKFGEVDISLDPFPVNGATTTCESLWMGVPVVSLEGKRFVSRAGLSILVNAGLKDWVAKDREDYVEKAVAQARDLSKLAVLRQGLRRQVLASPVFDGQRFAGNFERAMRGMWRTWCGQQIQGKR